MKTPRGGWSGGPQAKPATEYDIRYGSGLLAAQSSNLPRYAVVTTPSAYAAARPLLTQEPVGVMMPQSCDFAHLEALTAKLPQNVELVLGIGGGTALDVAKYVALSRHCPLVLVPTIVSTGAIIHGVFARWQGRRLIGGVDEWPWIDPECVLVDYDLALAAPDHLNCAGIGDVLCMYGGLAEWRRNAAAGSGPPWDEGLLGPSVTYLQRIAEQFPPTLGPAGELTSVSVRFITEALRERDSKSVRDPAFVGADHQFLHIMELVNDQSWIHGEIVALGATIVAWRCGDAPEQLVAKLESCRVRHLPSQIGVKKGQLWKGLQATVDYFAQKNVDSILSRDPMDKNTFEKLWGFLESA